MLFFGSFSLPLFSQANEAAQVSYQMASIEWSALDPGATPKLTLSGPASLLLKQEALPGSPVRFEVVDEQGLQRPDGPYKWGSDPT